MCARELHDGRADGLVPLESFELDEVHSFSDLLHCMSKTAFSGRQLGEAFDVMMEMVHDDSCTVVMTISGAMTIAKQGRMICDMIDRGLVQAVVCTGALMAHGLTESIGLTHYRYDAAKSDQTLFEQGYNRVYDTLEMEANLSDIEKMVNSVLQNTIPEDGVWSSARFCHAVGKKLSELNQGPGILRSAYEQHVPVFVPAFSDSELGLDFACWAMNQALKGRDIASLSHDEAMQAVPAFNPFYDLQQYARLVGSAESLGILTIGGGVPRNWAQQVGPYYDVTNDRVGTQLTPPRFRYGVRLCPEPVHWGGLSGCTYNEGVSWGKFLSPAEGGRYAEVYADATVAWPILMKAVFEQLDGQA